MKIEPYGPPTPPPLIPSLVSTGSAELDSFLNGEEAKHYRVRWSPGGDSLKDRLDRIQEAIAQVAMKNDFKVHVVEPGTYRFVPRNP